jgi:hypothetical protein
VYTSSVFRELAWRKSSCAVLRSTPAAGGKPRQLPRGESEDETPVYAPNGR